MRASPATRFSAARLPGGFTLAELLVVLSIIGVMAGSVVVALQGRTRQHALRVAAEDFTAALEYAAAQARQTGRPHRLTLTEGGRGYRVQVMDEAGQFTRVVGLAGRERLLPKGIVVRAAKSREPGTAALREIVLYGDGSGFEGSVVVASEAGEALTLRISPQMHQVTRRPATADE